MSRLPRGCSLLGRHLHSGTAMPRRAARVSPSPAATSAHSLPKSCRPETGRSRPVSLAGPGGARRAVRLDDTDLVALDRFATGPPHGPPPAATKGAGLVACAPRRGGRAPARPREPLLRGRTGAPRNAGRQRHAVGSKARVPADRRRRRARRIDPYLAMRAGRSTDPAEAGQRVASAAGPGSPSTIRSIWYAKNGFEDIRISASTPSTSAPRSPRTPTEPRGMPKSSAGSGSSP